MIDHFNKEQFEEALPRSKASGQPLWLYRGVVKGELVYAIPVGETGKVFIQIRSSIHRDGESADVGEDSIRCWLVDDAGRPLGGKQSRYVTRVPGWQKRMAITLKDLYKIGLCLKKCPTCREMQHACRAGQGENKGRLFQKCWTCNSGFEWLVIH